MRALYSYDAQEQEDAEEEEEMSFAEHQVLLIEDAHSNTDWWLARVPLSSPPLRGRIPSNYVQQLVPLGRFRLEYDYHAQTDEEVSVREGEVVDILDQSLGDWWVALVSTTTPPLYGLLPANYLVQVTDAQADTSRMHTIVATDDDDLTPIPTTIGGATTPTATTTTTTTTAPAADKAMVKSFSGKELGLFQALQVVFTINFLLFIL